MRDGGGGGEAGRETVVTVGRAGLDTVVVLVLTVVEVGRVGPGHERVVDALVDAVGAVGGFD